MARDEAYRQAELKIEEAKQSRAKELDLSGSYQTIAPPELIELPQSLGQLTQLQSLNLSNNRLTALPQSLGQLTQLQTLNLARNQLTALPEWLGQLTRLQKLVINSNHVTSLPNAIGELHALTYLAIEGNQIRNLPSSFRNLRAMQSLFLGFKDTGGGNLFVEVPDQLKHLTGLKELHLDGCAISDLPHWFLQLKNLEDLSLYENPLAPELAAAHEQGLDAVKKYLRELAKGARKRFEAKLLILGDGNEGKTCVSRALRELPFKQQLRTRGVDVAQWLFPHPDRLEDETRTIKLNIWDFEGQEINHQTHQFFLTTDSLYLLVFKCRDQFLLDRAEYWLDTIHARAPNAKVAIVITECENATPYVPEDRLQAEYADLLVADKWLFAVGCADNSGIPELQDALKRWAADLNFMGRDWPDSYERAESAIQQTAKAGTAHIDRLRLNEIFAEAAIDESSFDNVAASMATLGVITQFPACPDLRNFIVLQPQWLTKAISEIMEDGKLAHDRGQILLTRMRKIWEKKEYKGLFPTFHDCMNEFELCYDLDDSDRRCLVPLRFGYIKPQIPWSLGEHIKERRVTYKLNIRPPVGLMSRLIVKTHHMTVKTEEQTSGVYWHNGVFLRTGQGPLCSEALCEFDSGERTLRVTVRAAFPQNMIEQIHAYVKAVFSFFAGLAPVRSFGCIKIDGETETETQCDGAHSENRIAFAMESKEKVACEYGRHHVDPMQLIWGISSFGDSVQQIFRREMDKTPAWAKPVISNIDTLLNWANQHHELLQELQHGHKALGPEIKQEMELKLREYLGYFGQLLDDREETSAPGIISLNTVDRSVWDPKRYFQKKYVLTPFCECEQNIHPSKDGQVEFSRHRQWWANTAPWIARGTKVLSVGLQLAFAGMPLAMDPSVFEVIKKDVAFMKELAGHIEAKAPSPDTEDETAKGVTNRFDDGSLVDVRRDHKQARLMRAALARFLEEVAPNNYRARQWGSLHRVRMSDNSYRWLCENCDKRRRS